MIDVDSIGIALFNQVSTALFSGYTVEFGGAMRYDLGICPWVGVYADDMEIIPMRMGSNQPWTATLTLQLVVQHGSMVSAQVASTNLLNAMKPVMAAVNSDHSIGGTVNNMIGFSTSALERRPEENAIWFLSNIITITTEVDG